MVLEADEVAEVRRQHHIADAAVRAGPGVARFEVEDADAGDDAALLVDVAVTEELEPATDGEHRQPIFHRRPERGPLLLEVLGDPALLAILAAPDQGEIEGSRVEGVAKADGDDV